MKVFVKYMVEEDLYISEETSYNYWGEEQAHIKVEDDNLFYK